MTSGRRKTLDLFIEQAVEQLTAGGFDSPRREARVLLEAVAGIPLAEQLAHPDRLLDEESLASLEEALTRRLRHTPLGQITGKVWFCDLPFRVNGSTLIPRPETEHLVEAAFNLSCCLASSGLPMRILDTFTGTGAVGLSLGARLKREGLAFDLTLTDIAEEALEIAASNAKLILPGQDLQLVKADIWPPETEAFDLILANPPYIPSAEIASLMPEVARYEPVTALDGGPDGLFFYRRLAAEGESRLSTGGHLVLEAGAGQAQAVASIFDRAGWREEGRIRDYLGHERILMFSAGLM